MCTNLLQLLSNCLFHLFSSTVDIAQKLLSLNSPQRLNELDDGRNNRDDGSNGAEHLFPLHVCCDHRGRLHPLMDRVHDGGKSGTRQKGLDKTHPSQHSAHNRCDST